MDFFKVKIELKLFNYIAHNLAKRSHFSLSFEWRRKRFSKSQIWRYSETRLLKLFEIAVERDFAISSTKLGIAWSSQAKKFDDHTHWRHQPGQLINKLDFLKDFGQSCKDFYILGQIYKHVLNQVNNALTHTFVCHNVRTQHPNIFFIYLNFLISDAWNNSKHNWHLRVGLPVFHDNIYSSILNYLFLKR